MTNERVDAILKAIDFVEDHLMETITVADIAAVAGYSLYHFIRTFNQTIQHTPYDYLMRRRVSQAACALLDGDRRVIDIALDFQFNNHETFTRAFKRIFGMTPTCWRDNKLLDHRLIMPALGPDYLSYIDAPDFSAPRVVELGKIILTGLMTPLTNNHEEIPKLWRHLRDVLCGLSLVPGPHDFWGVHIQPHTPGGTCYYLAALKIPTLDFAPGVFVTKIIPAGDYVRFSQPSLMRNLDMACTFLYHTFLPKAGLTLAEPLEIEHFGDQCDVILPVRGFQKEGTFSFNKTA